MARHRAAGMPDAVSIDCNDGGEAYQFCWVADGARGLSHGCCYDK